MTSTIEPLIGTPGESGRPRRSLPPSGTGHEPPGSRPGAGPEPVASGDPGAGPEPVASGDPVTGREPVRQATP